MQHLVRAGKRRIVDVKHRDIGHSGCVVVVRHDGVSAGRRGGGLVEHRTTIIRQLIAVMRNGTCKGVATYALRVLEQAACFGERPYLGASTKKISHSPRDFGLARPPEEADLFSTLEDAPVTKLLLHVTRDKLKTHAMFPEVAANGWHV